MNTGQIKTQEQNGVVVFVVAGYFEGNAGKQLKAFVDERVRSGKLRFVLDLSECKVINSLGVAAVLEVSVKVTDDHRGRLVLTGLDVTKTSVFSLAGIIPYLQVAKNLAEAVRLAAA